MTQAPGSGDQPAQPASASASKCGDVAEREADRAAQIARFKYLTEVALPERARAERWPLRNDHCFKRVCLDFAVEDVWYRHVRKPAERHIAGEALDRAVRCAEELLREGEGLLRQRNRESLQHRGKLRD